MSAHTIGTTSHEIANAKNSWQYHKIAYNTYKAIDHALKSQLLWEIDAMFLDGICTGPVGFATQTPRDILDCLYLTYRKVPPLDVIKNCLSISKPYNSTTLIKNL